MSFIESVFLCLAIGFVAGLRSMTAPAAVSWAAYCRWLHLEGTPLGFMSSPVAVGVFTLAALAEYVADKLPNTPNRTSVGPLIARVVLGGLSGAAVGAAAGLMVPGALLGGVGAVLGAFAGFQARRRLVARTGGRDLPVALAEDIVAIVIAYLVVRG